MRVVVSSFENILINKDEAINLETMLEIERIRKRGDLFIASTDNSLDYVLPYNRDFPFLDFIIALNGACLYDVNLEKVILKRKLRFSFVKKIVINFNDCDIYVYTTFSRIKINSLLDLENNKKDILKIDIYSKKENINQIIRKLKSMNLELNICEGLFNSNKFVEITSVDASKIFCLEQICKKTKIDLGYFNIIGGNISDLDLIKKFKGSCVNNSPNKIKRASKEIMNGQDSYGVFEFLRKI